MNVINLSAGSIDYDDRGSGPAIVLVHGLHMNASVWREVVPELERAYRCIVPTLPLGGHRTPMDPAADLSPRGVAALLGEFLAELDLADVTLVGNDTGGVFAQLLAAGDASRIARLVLVSCEAFDNFPPGLPGRVSALAARMAGRPVPGDLLDSWFGPLRRSAGVRRDLERFVAGIPGTDLTRTARDLSAFDRPALIAWGADDRVMPLAHADRLADHLPDSSRVDVRDSRTLVPLDQPQVMADLVAEFVRGQQPGPQADLSDRAGSPSSAQ